MKIEKKYWRVDYRFTLCNGYTQETYSIFYVEKHADDFIDAIKGSLDVIQILKKAIKTTQRVTDVEL